MSDVQREVEFEEISSAAKGMKLKLSSAVGGIAPASKPPKEQQHLGSLSGELEMDGLFPESDEDNYIPYMPMAWMSCRL